MAGGRSRVGKAGRIGVLGDLSGWGSMSEGTGQGRHMAVPVGFQSSAEGSSVNTNRGGQAGAQGGASEPRWEGQTESFCAGLGLGASEVWPGLIRKPCYGNRKP